MTDESEKSNSVFPNSRNETERPVLAPQGGPVAFHSQIQEVVDSIRRYHDDIMRATAWRGLASSLMADVMKAAEQWRTMIQQVAASSLTVADLAGADRTWTQVLKAARDQRARLQEAATVSSVGMLHRLTISETIRGADRLEAGLRRAPFPKQAIATLGARFGDMVRAYGTLGESIHTRGDMTRLPSYSLPGATREVFVTVHAVDAVRVAHDGEAEQIVARGDLVSQAREESSMCISLLGALDPALCTLYVGAREAFEGGNPDRARHVLSSLRELLDHVLRRLAPDELVLTWMPAHRDGLLHAGRPTRRARVLYVCRNLKHPPLTDFVDEDVRTSVKLVEVFNHVHELRPGLSDVQLGALILRVDSWLTYILQISGIYIRGAARRTQ